eukprot:TRINITY_DN93_c0_g1_i2.p1 TRINITY_DN93_c0_g1~~TRINITY_DN93_c0_g1_i2.p1  ORF type:complete len:628 (-),score=122.59 TRINITY_DN93_c0_g1_i2:1988-3871(-)
MKDRLVRCCWVVVVALILTNLQLANCQVTKVTIDFESVIRDVSDNPVGMNLNYLMDSDRQRTVATERSTVDALAEMAPGYLRYPGGEKADGYYFSSEPWEESKPMLARTGQYEWPAGDDRFLSDWDVAESWVKGKEPMDFDEFMAVCGKIGSRPNIVLAYDSAYLPATSGGTAPTLDSLLTHATEWVRYANVKNNYAIEYWEIGNESDYGPSYNGADPGAEQYAADLVSFSTSMKEVDPSVKIGANGHSTARFRTLLEKAASSIDFLIVHTYPMYEYIDGYTTYLNSSPSFVAQADQAVRAIRDFAPDEDKNRIKVALTETNSIDYAADGKGWKNYNDLGHALVTFDIIGQHLLIPELLFAEFWNTRWVSNDAPTEEDAVFDAIDKLNQLTAMGRAMAIWGQFIGDEMVSTSSDDDRVLVWASRTEEEFTVFLLNKRLAARVTEVVMGGITAPSSPGDTSAAARWSMTAVDTSSTEVTWKQGEDVMVLSTDHSFTVSLPAHSITVVVLSTGVEATFDCAKPDRPRGVRAHHDKKRVYISLTPSAHLVTIWFKIEDSGWIKLTKNSEKSEFEIRLSKFEDKLGRELSNTEWKEAELRLKLKTVDKSSKEACGGKLSSKSTKKTSLYEE